MVNILRAFPEGAEPLRQASQFTGEFLSEGTSGRDEYRTITFHVGGEGMRLLTLLHEELHSIQLTLHVMHENDGYEQISGHLKTGRKSRRG